MTYALLSTGKVSPLEWDRALRKTHAFWDKMGLPRTKVPGGSFIPGGEMLVHFWKLHRYFINHPSATV